ncbi:hypothetical protein A0H81_12009 [Grifola frondosa]|uniref:Malonyl-CoA:ACP transacylase (MAT) domain-containing protein n=1 Tax=Grifola frondosa TaxID=5627 RepID=A0A1C7LUR4_GRIFR|nr:hypothetical protein A0H81_12009 [Grifola frondosa]
MDIAYSNTARRKLFPHRVAVTSRSAVELLGNLRNTQIVEVVPQKGRERAKVLFAFSGQGGQYIGMGVELHERVPLGLVTAGVLKLDDALRLVAVRGPELHPCSSPRCGRMPPTSPCFVLPLLGRTRSPLPMISRGARSSMPSRLSRGPPAVSFCRHVLLGDLRGEHPTGCCRARFDTPKPRFSLLDSWVGLPSAEGIDGMFETPFSLLADLVEGHKVSGFTLCPASVYHELAAASAQLMLEHLRACQRTLCSILPGSSTRTRSSTLQMSRARISSYTTGGEHQPYCMGIFDVRGSSERASKPMLASTMV